jgi:uncharacterized protein with von Willebrand factor type A (vWA) domain
MIARSLPLSLIPQATPEAKNPRGVAIPKSSPIKTSKNIQKVYYKKVKISIQFGKREIEKELRKERKRIESRSFRKA